MKLLLFLLVMHISAIALGQSYSEILKDEQSFFLCAINNLENNIFYHIEKKISSEELELNDFNVRLLYSDSVKNALCNLLDKALTDTAISPLYCLELCSYSHDSILIEKGRNLLNLAKSTDERYKMICYLTRMGDSNAIKNFLKYNKKRCVKDRVDIMWDIDHYYYTEEGIRFCANYIKSNAHAKMVILSDYSIPVETSPKDTIPDEAFTGVNLIDVEMSPKDTIPDSQEIDDDDVEYRDLEFTEEETVIDTFEGSHFYVYYFWSDAWRILRHITNPDFWDCIGFPNPHLRENKDDFTQEPNTEEFFTKHKRRMVYKWVKHNYGNYQLEKFVGF